MNPFYQKPGATYDEAGNCQLTLWAPLKNTIHLKILYPKEATYPMQKDAWGYWTIKQRLDPGTRYMYRIDDALDRPDPASVSQPDGVHGSSEIIRSNFNWTDQDWKGKSLDELIMYEIHTGTFSEEGTFDAIVSKLPYFKELGINAIELMPIAQFPGDRNWGYDGVYPFAIHPCYGNASSLKNLVNEAHRTGIVVILDVVYNHMGPDGSYLRDFGPYFTNCYKTPWGDALNFDGPYCDGVRSYFIHNALRWLDEFHIDGLRMDAVHAMWDYSAIHIMQELQGKVRQLEDETGRKKILIAELDLNNTRYINAIEQGGYGLDGQWIDEFHHALHSLLTGETDGYYSDFGAIKHLENALRNTYVYNNTYSEHRKKIFGMQVRDNPYNQFIVFSQNHDHIGNRPIGDRLAASLSFESLKLSAAAVLLSPYVPMLFMGEEYGEKNPFFYFVNHENEELSKNICEGRKKEFSYFNFKNEFPDPGKEEVFLQSKLSWNYDRDDSCRVMLSFYKHLISFRKKHPAMLGKERHCMKVHEAEGNVLSFERMHGGMHVLIAFNFGKQKQAIINNTGMAYTKLFDSSDHVWNGSGNGPCTAIDNNSTIEMNPVSAVVYEKNF
jgi:maltooligosyltrehalose trehalohydrolase